MFIQKISSIFRRLIYFLVGVLLFFAIVTVLAHIFTPLLEEYRPAFEQWAGKLLNAPVSIGSLKAKWIGVRPDLTFENVTVFSKDQKQTIFHVDQLKISLSPLKTLFSRRLQPSTLDVIGVHLVVSELPSGQLQVQSFVKGQKQLDQQSKATDLAQYLSHTLLSENTPHQKIVFTNGQNVLLTWLLSQSHLSFRDVILDFKSPQVKAWSISLNKLDIINRGSHHVLYGVAKILDPHVTFIHIGLSLVGDLQDQDKLSATLYVKLNNVLLQKWLSQHLFYGNRINRGILDGECWVKWEKGQLKSIQTVVNINQLNLQSEFLKQPLNIERFSGNLLWTLQSNGWQVSGDQVFLKMPNMIWPKNQFILKVAEKNGHPLYQQFWIRYIKLKDVRWFLNQLKSSPNIKILSELNPLGELWELFLDHRGNLDNWNDFQLSTAFSHLNVQKWQYIPGITNLSGRLQLTPTNGTLLLHSTHSTFDFGNLFKNPILLNILSGSLHWYQDIQKTMVVKATDIIAADDHVALSGQFGLLWPQNSLNPMISLLAGFDVDDSLSVKNYLPIGVLKQPLLGWLNRAFIGGEGLSGTVIFRGRVKEFPFDHHEGVFIVDSNLRNLDFQYSKEWPLIEEMNGRLLFSNRKMFCLADSGKIQGTTLQSVRANIPYIGHRQPVIVHVNGKATGQANHLLNIVRHSPLKRLINNDLSSLKAEGDVDLQLKLSVPLKKLKEIRANGDIHFSNVSFDLFPWHLQVDRMKGNLSFTESGLSSGVFNGNLFGKSTEFLIETVKKPKEKPFTKISFQNRFGSEIMKKYLHYSTPFVRGESPFQAEVNLYVADNGQRKSRIVLSSNLSGIEIDLLPPFKKLSDEIIPTIVTFSAKNVLAEYGDRLSAALSFKNDQKPWQLFSANLHFGEGVAKVQAEKGLFIDGFLSEFDYKAWYDYWLKEMAQLNKLSQKSMQDFLRLVHVTIGKIKILGQTLVQAAFKIEPKEAGFNVGINSHAVQGDLIITPSQLKNSTVVGTFKRLHLVSDVSEKKLIIKPSQLPNLNIEANDFQYDQYSLGSVHLVTKSSGNTFQVKELVLTSPELAVALSGNYKSLSSGEMQSEIFGEASSEQLTALFNKFKIKSNLMGTTAYAKFHLNWLGAIYDPQFKKMQGDIAFKLGRGHIIKLDEETEAKLNLGFILSLFSVHRLMSMDFSQSGFSFDKFQGDLKLQSGYITTNNTYFDGSIARIDVKGKINMIQAMLDLDLIIAPYITSSLPVIATLAGGPLAGAAVWFADKIVGKEVGKMARHHYKITGNWHQPMMQKV